MIANIFIFTIIGSYYPVELIHVSLRWLAYSSPITMPLSSFRSILTKGTEFYEPEAFLGYIVGFAWIFGLLGLCIVILKYK